MPHSETKNILTSKWIFRVKEVVTNDGRVTKRAKARLVARGFQQVHGMDYGETYTPVVKCTSIRILLALFAHLDFELHQMDVVTVFWNGEVEEDIYMEIPERVSVSDKNLVCKLIKSLYCLKQAPKRWNVKIDPFLVEKLGFKKCSGDPCLYIKVNNNGDIIVIALYVDDLLIAGNNMRVIAWIKGR